MKFMTIAAILALAIRCAYADVTDKNFLDQLLVEKTKAQGLVLQLKTELDSQDPRYSVAKQKYTAAEVAFNNYTKAMVDNYQIGKDPDLKGSAQLAALRAQEFENYVSGLKLQSKGSFSAAFAAAAVLLEISEKLYSFVVTQQQEQRLKTAKAIASQVTWDDWDKIGAL
jgi:hypothetical protein